MYSGIEYHAALRGTTISAFLFEGTDAPYDEWFDNLLAEDCEEDGFGNLIWSCEKNIHGETVNAITLEPYRSVVLYNDRMSKLNHVLNFYLVSIDEFDEQFFQIGSGLAALKEDCVEYFCFEEAEVDKFEIGSALVPIWVRTFLLNKFERFNFNSFGVFIRNRLGMVQFIENPTFVNCYES